MRTRTALLVVAAAAGFAITAVDTAVAEGMQGGMGPGMMQGGTDHQGVGHGGMQGGMGPAGANPGMDQCMHAGMGAGQHMGGRGMMMGAGRTQDGMMSGGMGSGMMGQHMGRGMLMGRGMMGSDMMHGGARSGMGALFGSQVRPVMNLSVDDVRGSLALQLEGLNNKRLKVGDLKSEDGTITADIVTVDN